MNDLELKRKRIESVVKTACLLSRNFMKKHTALLVLAAALLCSGCASVHEKYKETVWYTPDSFNYTYATD